ncbi:MAG: hypothetical protein ABDH16_04835 [Thermodesulfovibrionaceae bacterium]
MKFEIKIVVAFTATMILILFYLNTVVIGFFDYVKQDLIFHFLDNKPPSKKFIEEKFNEYLKDVLLWEVLLVLSMTLILYKVIYKMGSREREYRSFLELILLTVSHKFGNFLTVQKGNIEILKARYDEKAIKRLENSYNYLKEDFQRIIDTINRFRSFSSKKEKINLKNIIENTLSLFDFKGKLKTNLEDFQIYSNRQLFDSIIFSLIENAIKYSKETINIRLTKKYLAIRNDITDREEKGSGVGLKITESLLKKEGFQMRYRVKGDNFLVVLKLR